MNAEQGKDKGVIVLVLGILGLVGCCICAPIAWWMGSAELAAMDAGQVSSENRQLAMIGKILGMVGTAFIVLGVLFYVLMFALAGGAAMMGN